MFPDCKSGNSVESDDDVRMVRCESSILSVWTKMNGSTFHFSFSVLCGGILFFVFYVSLFNLFIRLFPDGRSFTYLFLNTRARGFSLPGLSLPLSFFPPAAIVPIRTPSGRRLWTFPSEIRPPSSSDPFAVKQESLLTTHPCRVCGQTRRMCARVCFVIKHCLFNACSRARARM